jgi:NADPH:quinone reductase-like Zn-dependent oxidoreductase
VKAVIFDGAGEPASVLAYRDVPEPGLEPGHVLVEVAARPVQPADLMFIRGNYRVRPRFPQVAGLEGVGRIVARAGNAGPSSGTRVAFRAPGAWAERVSVPLGRVYPVPDGINDAEASQFALNGITAWALLAELDARPGDWIAATAAHSTVVRLVAALAAARGIRLVGTIRALNGAIPEAAAPFPMLRQDHPGLTQSMARLVGATGLAGILDSVGGRVVTALLPAVRKGGKIIAYGVLSHEATEVANAALVYANLTWKGFGIDYWLDTTPPETLQHMARELWDAIGRGQLTMPVAHRVPMANFTHAIELAAQSSGRGKVLLTET